jgi:hypothetical protein
MEGALRRPFSPPLPAQHRLPARRPPWPPSPAPEHARTERRGRVYPRARARARARDRMYLSRMNSSRTLSCASGATRRPSGSAASHTLPRRRNAAAATASSGAENGACRKAVEGAPRSLVRQALRADVGGPSEAGSRRRRNTRDYWRMALRTGTRQLYEKAGAALPFGSVGRYQLTASGAGQPCGAFVAAGSHDGKLFIVPLVKRHRSGARYVRAHALQRYG